MECRNQYIIMEDEMFARIYRLFRRTRACSESAKAEITALKESRDPDTADNASALFLDQHDTTRGLGSRRDSDEKARRARNMFII